MRGPMGVVDINVCFASPKSHYPAIQDGRIIGCAETYLNVIELSPDAQNENRVSSNRQTDPDTNVIFYIVN